MNILIYLLQVSACTAVFYLFYYLFLNRLTFFSTNRWYLLVTALLSFVIPLITIPMDHHPYAAVVQQALYTPGPQETQIIIQPVATHAVEHPINWLLMLKLAYLIAVVALSIHTLISIFRFFKRMQGKRI